MFLVINAIELVNELDAERHIKAMLRFVQIPQAAERITTLWYSSPQTMSTIKIHSIELKLIGPP